MGKFRSLWRVIVSLLVSLSYHCGYVICAHSFSVEAPRSDQMVINCGDVGEDPRVGVGCE